MNQGPSAPVSSCPTEGHVYKQRAYVHQCLAAEGHVYQCLERVMCVAVPLDMCTFALSTSL